MLTVTVLLDDTNQSQSYLHDKWNILRTVRTEIQVKKIVLFNVKKYGESTIRYATIKYN